MSKFLMLEMFNDELPAEFNRVSAFHDIASQYKNLIACDPILRYDFKQLLNHFAAFSFSTTQNFEKTIQHLIAETKESAIDEQRIADESPVGMADCAASNRNLYRRVDLLKMLEDYQSNYLFSTRPMFRLGF